MLIDEAGRLYNELTRNCVEDIISDYSSTTSTSSNSESDVTPLLDDKGVSDKEFSSQQE